MCLLKISQKNCEGNNTLGRGGKALSAIIPATHFNSCCIINYYILKQKNTQIFNIHIFDLTS